MIAEHGYNEGTKCFDLKIIIVQVKCLTFVSLLVASMSVTIFKIMFVGQY